MTDLATAMIEYFEGLKLTAYKDTLGIWTIGYGHVLSPPDHDWTGYAIDQAAAASGRQTDMEHARVLATGFANYQRMNDVRQAVCISMCFQMGSKPLYWPKFNAALEVSDWKGAAQEGRNSEWYRQTPARAELEMTMMETGVWNLPVGA